MDDLSQKTAKFIEKNLIAIVSLVSSILVLILNEKYKSDCEQFYQIPGKYFSPSLNNILFLIIMFGGLSFLGIMPSIMLKFEKNAKNSVKIFCIFFATFVGLIMGIVMFLFLGMTKSIYDNWFCLILVAVAFIFTFVGIFMLTSKDNFEGILKNKLFGTVFIVIFVLSVVGAMFTVVNSSKIIFRNVKYKSLYEFTTVQNSPYIIVSEYDGNYVVMSYHIEKDKYVLYKGNYKLIGKNSCDTIEYKSIDIK